jgi:acetyl/propionyl-CoA carboxylase alpha subunit
LDDGFEEGMTIPIYYDPMLAKLITYGKDREEAIQLMIGAISQYKIRGISTTLPFGKFVCEHQAFTSGKFDTHFVKNYYTPELLQQQYSKEREMAAMVGLKLFLEHQDKLKVPNSENSKWPMKRTNP